MPASTVINARRLYQQVQTDRKKALEGAELAAKPSEPSVAVTPKKVAHIDPIGLTGIRVNVSPARIKSQSMSWHGGNAFRAESTPLVSSPLARRPPRPIFSEYTTPRTPGRSHQVMNVSSPLRHRSPN